jgi:pimeloyl-ACP methyl ester carboxylesterase/membrane protein DedA with SNARE-associated domain
MHFMEVQSNILKYGRWQTITVIYILLLTISYLVRLSDPLQPEVAADQKTVTLNHSGRPAIANQKIKIAYRDTDSDASGRKPVILLLHGSPIAARRTFQGLIPALKKSGRAIAPDLPGFGTSTREISDYSIKAHAAYMIEFLKRLGIEKLHIVAYSMGGGVALNMAHLSPERIRSLTMLSALGVQEFELLGNYHLNHVLHGVQLAFIWLLYKGLPHMGLLDRIPLDISYARNFFDTDQRPLRKYLAEFKSPMLIVHGQQDALVPVTAAREHFRIVPQSELKLYEGGHLMLFKRPDQLAEDIGDFIHRVVTGKAISRDTADRQRLLDADKPFDEIAFPPASGLTLMIFILLIALATLISEDLTCIGAGLMAARGTIGFIPAVAGSFLGIFLGDILLFLAGKHLGRPALGFAPLKWFVKDEDVIKTSRWFSAKGPIIITISRFLPGSRLPTYFGAGMLGTGFWLFSLYFLIAAAIWTPLLVGLSTVIGSQMLVFYDQFKHYGLFIVLGTVLSLRLLAKLAIPLSSSGGRRLLGSALRRKIHKVSRLFF